MNKHEFIKELSKKLNLSEEICSKVNDVLENNFILGKNNKMKIINELKEKLGLSDEIVEKIYNVAMELIGSSIKEKIINPFKGLD